MVRRLDDRVLLTTAEVTALFHLPRKSVHRWACEDGWRRYGTRAARHWDLEQVEASHDRRRGVAGEEL